MKVILSLPLQLPYEIVEYIYNFIPLSILAFLTKTNYLKYHKYVKHTFSKELQDSYIRFVIRNDLSFVVEQLIKENITLWLNYKKYKFKKIIYIDYFHYLYYFCIDNRSENCKNLFYDVLKKTGTSQNQYKKNIVTNVRWTN